LDFQIHLSDSDVYFEHDIFDQRGNHHYWG
jgi:hypothetical protein